MHAYFLAYLWSLFVLCSILGWGFAVLLVFKRQDKADLAWQGALGVSLSVTVGGVLNLFSLISKTSIEVFLAVGGLLFLASIFLNLKAWLLNFKSFKAGLWANKGLLVLVAVILAVVFVRYSSAVAFYAYHGTDDQHAYMVFPVKMLETGSLGNDPFSERRLASSLGGQSFLNTFILTGADAKNLHTMDNGIGLILFLFVLVALLKDRKLDLSLSILVVLCAAVLPSPVGNITSFYIAATLFFTLCRFVLRLGDASQNSWADLFLLAMLAAGACTLKSNMIAPTAILFLVYFLYSYKAGAKPSRVISALGFSGLLTVIFLLPWMVSLKQSSHTWLFPVLGKGLDGSQYGDYLSRYLEFNLYSAERLVSESIVGVCFFAAFLFLAGIWIKSPKDKDRTSLLVMFLAAAIGFLSLIYGMGGYSVYYYSLSFLMPVFFSSLVLILKKGDQPVFSGGSVKALTLGLIVLFFIFGTYVQQDTEIFAAAKDSLNIDSGLKLGLLNGDLMPPAEFKQYSALQSSIPAGETILGRLDRNFMFDFKRNNIFIIDIPGGSAFAPGIPFKRGSEAMADYFVSVGVKYVAYSYGNQANFTHSIGDSMLRPHVNPLLRTQAAHAFDLQDNLFEIYKNKTRKILYDDGKNIVLDLSVK